MKKLFSPLFVFLFSFISILLISCSNLNGSAESSVSFSLSQELFTAASNRAAIISGSSDEASLTIEITLFTESGTKLSTQSETHTSSEWKELLSSDKKTKQIAFGNLPVGAKIYAAGEIFEDSTSLLKGQTEVITVKTGLNTMRLVFKSSESEKSIPLDGTITIEDETIKYTLTKNTSASSEKFYLNKGTFAFSLIDKDGNDVLADVNWDAYSETDGFLNQHLLNISYEITYKGHSVNSLSDDGFNYVQISSYNPLTKGGSYLLTLTVSPNVSKTTYVNKSGQSVDFPDFEPVSGTFEVEVEDYLYAELDFTDIASDDISTALTNALSGLTTESSIVYFKVSGQTSVYYTNLFSSINSAIANASPLFFIDASDLTTTYSAKDIQSCAMQSCSKIQGLILPDDVDHIGGYAFTGCSNLETVVFGKGLKSMSTSFDSCSKLSSVTFPEDSSFESFGNMSFSNCSALKTLKLPASIKGISSNALYDSGIEEFTLEDTSGSWYYTFDSDTYWAWMDGTLAPPSGTENAAEGSCGLVADLQTVQPQSQYSGQSPYTFPDGTSLIQKLTWLAKQTSNTGADFTKSIYLFHKSE
ncbi:MAG: leucine-rich repeat domain-containing protein [Treponema sp.]|nr:leucine-rich repeat domain-containing protein [Treponema sp.]